MGEASRHERQSDPPLLFALYLLIYLTVLLRMVLRSPAEGTMGAPAYALMAVYLVLSVTQIPLSGRWSAWTHIYLALQCGIVTCLFLTEPTVDFYGILCVGLSIVATRDLHAPWDIAWLAIVCFAVTAGLILAFGAAAAVGYIPVYIAASLVLGLYGRTSRKAEAARARSEELRAELEAANRRLRAYAERAEEAAAATERTRLARDLHDAATQTVFSMNLTAEAARMALVDDPGRVPPLLERLQELCRDALGEMRSLVRELHPPTIAEEGLAAALQRHAAARERRDGMRVIVTVQGTERGSMEVREILYRAAVEALNNVAKHAGVPEARVEVCFAAASAGLTVTDTGKGFDVSAPRSPESFGLLAMGERADALGGSVRVHSTPGAGTRVEVSLPLDEEERQ
jgi:signal transduction histidine kinase